MNLLLSDLEYGIQFKRKQLRARLRQNLRRQNHKLQTMNLIQINSYARKMERYYREHKFRVWKPHELCMVFVFGRWVQAWVNSQLDENWIDVTIGLPYCIQLQVRDIDVKQKHIRKLTVEEMGVYRNFWKKFNSRYLVVQRPGSSADNPDIVNVAQYLKDTHAKRLNGFNRLIIDYFFHNPECVNHTSPKDAYYWWQFRVGKIKEIPYRRKRHRTNHAKNLRKRRKKLEMKQNTVEHL